MAKTRKYIQRLSTVPTNRGEAGSGLQTGGLRTGGLDRSTGLGAPPRPLARSGGENLPQLATGPLTNSNRPGGGGGGDPIKQASGLDRWYQMNPEASPGSGYNRKESTKQSRHRQSMREKSEKQRVAQIQGTMSEEAGLSRRTGDAIRATQQGEVKRKKKRDDRNLENMEAIDEIAAQQQAIDLEERRQDMETQYSQRLSDPFTSTPFETPATARRDLSAPPIAPAS